MDVFLLVDEDPFVSRTERLANLYALIRSVERLETAYVNSSAHAGAYEAACSELITKYKTLRNALVDTVPDVHRFMQVEIPPLPFAAMLTIIYFVA